MSEKELGNIEAILLQLDQEGPAATAKIAQYLTEGKGYLDEQLQKNDLDVTVNPTPRQIQLVESYAVGKFTLLNTKSHSETLFNAARSDIKTHVAAILQNQTEDGVATGSNQFRKSDGNVRTGNGI